MPRKERMPLDLVRAARAEASRGIALQQTGHDALRLVRDVVREDKRVGEDALVHHVHVLVVERWKAGLGVRSRFKVACVSTSEGREGERCE